MRLFKSQKGFVPVLIILIIAILLVGGGLYLKSRGQLHNFMPGGPQNSQGNFDPVMQALGCNSQQSCMELCQKPENQSKCQQVFRQYGAGNQGQGGPGMMQSQNQNFAMAGNNGDSNTSNLPDCSTNALFDHLPTDANAYTGVEPLGHMSGQHVLPSQADHVYINMVKGPSGYSQVTNVYSPGNVVLLQAVKKSNYLGQSQSITDYLLEFSPCKSVIFTFDHIRNLNDKIMSAIASKTPVCQGGGVVHQNCTYQDLGVSLSSGEKIGTAGGSDTFSYSFDFGGADIRTQPLAFIDQSPAVQTGVTADSYLHNVCPLDYFSDSLKATLYSKLTIKNAGVNGIPQCGTTMQDLAGTLQGNWYHQGSTKSYQGLNIQGSLAFAHSNLDPSMAEISAGTDLLPSTDLGAQILFSPQSSGYINREPSQVKNDGHVYCFDGSEGAGGGGNEGHVDLQFVNDSQMKVDYGSGACAVNPAIQNPLIYAR